MPDANSVELNDPGNPNYKYFVTVGVPQAAHRRRTTPIHRSCYGWRAPRAARIRRWDCDRGGQYSFEDEIRDRLPHDGTSRTTETRQLTATSEWNNILCPGYEHRRTSRRPRSIRTRVSGLCDHRDRETRPAQLREGLKTAFRVALRTEQLARRRWRGRRLLWSERRRIRQRPALRDADHHRRHGFHGSRCNDPLPIKYFAGFYITGLGSCTERERPAEHPGLSQTQTGQGHSRATTVIPLYGCRALQSTSTTAMSGATSSTSSYSPARATRATTCARSVETRPRASPSWSNDLRVTRDSCNPSSMPK